MDEERHRRRTHASSWRPQFSQQSLVSPQRIAFDLHGDTEVVQVRCRDGTGASREVVRYVNVRAQSTGVSPPRPSLVLPPPIIRAGPYSESSLVAHTFALTM